MKIFFDTEFIEDGKTIDLLSIGAIREDGAAFYAESEEADHSKASEWVRLNVLPHLLGGVARHSRKAIADTFRVFCGPQPEFWAYYSDYDWVALCQLYGRMVDLPDSWPMFCRDVKQLCVDRGNPELPPREGTEHHALQDARWARDAWEFLSVRPEALPSAWVATSDNGSVLHFSKADGWQVNVVQTMPSPLARSQEKT